MFEWCLNYSFRRGYVALLIIGVERAPFTYLIPYCALEDVLLHRIVGVPSLTAVESWLVVSVLCGCVQGSLGWTHRS